MSPLSNGSVEFPAHAVVQCQTAAGLPGILHKRRVRAAVNGRGTDMRSIREQAGSDGDGVSSGTAGKQSADSIGQQCAGLDIVHSTCRGYEFSGVSRASAKVVFTVGADAKVGSVA